MEETYQHGRYTVTLTYDSPSDAVIMEAARIIRDKASAPQLKKTGTEE